MKQIAQEQTEKLKAASDTKAIEELTKKLSQELEDMLGMELTAAVMKLWEGHNGTLCRDMLNVALIEKTKPLVAKLTDKLTYPLRK